MNEEDYNPSQIEAHKVFLEKVGAEEPKRSCDMVRAWMKLNLESFLAPIGNN